MQNISAIRILAIFVLTLSFAAIPGTSHYFSLPRVHADHAPLAGTDGTRWVPAGPNADKLRITVFTDEQAEFNALQATPSQLDLTDWPLSKSFIPTFTNDARFFVTAPSPEFGMFDIDFNHANTFFGILPDNHGTSLAGQEFRAAVAHLIDKPTFISNIVGLAGALDNAMPPGQGVLHTGLPFNSQNPQAQVCVGGPSTTVACTSGAPGFSFDGVPGTTFTSWNPNGNKDWAFDRANDLKIDFTAGGACSVKFTPSNTVIPCPPLANNIEISWVRGLITDCQWTQNEAILAACAVPAGSNDFHFSADGGIVKVFWTFNPTPTIPGTPFQTITPEIIPSAKSNNVTFSFTPATATGPYSVDYQLSSGAVGTFALGGVCNWEKIATPSCSSAYRDQAGFSDSNGMALGPAEGGPSADFCTAADYLVASGLASAKQANCTIGVANWKGTASVNFQVRVDSAPRLALGDAIVGRLCELIALTTCPVNDNHITIQQAVPTIFTTGSTSLSWHIYTAGWGLTPQFDQLFALYNSQFASTECGGKRASFGQDYVYYCDPMFDKFTNMLEFNDTLSGAIVSANAAMDVFGRAVTTIPIWSANHQFAYNKGWTGINDAVGLGIPYGFSELNGWSSTPTLDVNGNSVLRWGFKQGTTNLNPWLITTVWEFFVDAQVFDSLISANPYNPSTDLFGYVANQFQILGPQPGDPAGTKQDIQIALRPDVFFHDGTRLTAQDVKFSILGAQQVGGGSAALVAGVSDVTILGSNLFRINLFKLSPFALVNTGGVTIIPQHIWASDTTAPCATKGSTQCTVNTNFLSGAPSDPIINGREIGSGAWRCVSQIDGTTGGHCTTPSGGAPGSGSQFTSAGDNIILQRNAASTFIGTSPSPTGGGLDGDAYFRTSAKYLQWQWADIFGRGTVDLVDFASAKGCTNLAAATAGCGHWDTPGATITTSTLAGSTTASSSASFGGNNDGTVNVVEVAQAASWVGISWTFPLAYGINHSTGVTTGPPSGAQTIPQTIYEGGVTYVAETAP